MTEQALIPAFTTQTPEGGFGSFAERYERVVERLEVTLQIDAPATGRPDIMSLRNPDADLLLAESLTSPDHMPRTVELLERAVYGPQLEGLAGPELHAMAAQGWAWRILESPVFILGFAEQYIQHRGTPMGDRLIDLMIAKVGHEVMGWVEADDPLRTAVARELPDLLTRAARRTEDEMLERPPRTMLRDADLAYATKSILSFPPTGMDVAYAVRALDSLWRADASFAYADTVVDSVLSGWMSAQHLLWQWGLNADELENSWIVGYGQDCWPNGDPREDVPTTQDYREQNVTLIKELERETPGLCRTLRRTHGLRNFARDDKSVLLGMYEAMSSGKRFAHNVVFARARSDNNGAGYHKKRQHAALYADLTAKGVGVHFVEYASQQELEFMLRAWAVLHPGETFDVISPFGHGSRTLSVEVDRTARGRRGVSTEITSANIRASRLGSLLRKVASDYLVMPLNICFSGEDQVDGVGAVVHELTNAHVTAPDGAASLQLTIEAEDGRVSSVGTQYNTRYAVGNTWVGQPTTHNEFGAPVA